MKNDKQGFFENVWVLRIVSLILALLLFTYVVGSKTSSTRQTARNSQNNALMATKTETLKVPLEIKANAEKYVITGYPEYVKIKITGPSALVTTTANTQNFKVYADLTKLTLGKHEVSLKASGLNKDLHYSLNPAQIKVKVQTRNTATVPVEVRLSSHSVNGDFQVGTPKAALDKVQITGAKDEVKQVAKVIAYVNLPKNAQSTLHRTVTLQAINVKGQTMNVVIMPNTMDVTIPISANASVKDSNSSDSTKSEKTDDMNATSKSSADSVSSSEQASSSSE